MAARTSRSSSSSFATRKSSDELKPTSSARPERQRFLKEVTTGWERPAARARGRRLCVALQSRCLRRPDADRRRAGALPPGVSEGSPGEGKKLREAARLLVRGEFQTDEDVRQEEDQLAEQFAFFGPPAGRAVVRRTRAVLPLARERRGVRPLCVLRTQWRHGLGGPTGLDYRPSCPHGRVRIRGSKFDALYEAVRIMEQGARGLRGASQRKRGG
jgi:hypothetical protein